MLVFFLFRKRNKGVWAKVLLSYVALCFTSDSILLPLDSVVYEKLIYTILSGFTIIEYSLFAFFLYSIIANKAFKLIILVATIGFYLFALFYFFSASDKSFDSLAASVESILIIAFCILYLFDQLSKPQMMFIYQDPNFWFVVGFMVYLSGNLFLFIQANNLHNDIREKFWKIALFSNVVKNILFAIAFSTKKAKPIQGAFGNPFGDDIDDIFENPSKS